MPNILYQWLVTINLPGMPVEPVVMHICKAEIMFFLIVLTFFWH
jgi:hypothetical protein